MQRILGIDIGGTGIKARVFDPDGRVLAECEETPDRPEDTVERIQAVIRHLEDSTGGPFHLLGMGMRGIADRSEKCIISLPEDRQSIVGLDWSQALCFQGSIRVMNDAHAALLGELWQGAARGAQNAVLVTLGTGVGGALVVDGRLYRGRFGKAGLIGHICLDPHGPPGVSGMPGSLEDFIGNQTVARRSAGKFSTTRRLVEAVRDGDAEASEVWERSLDALACGLVSVVNVVDPEVIVIGGGIADAGADLFDPLRSKMRRLEWRVEEPGVRVVPAMLGRWSGTCGAAFGVIDSTNQEGRGSSSSVDR